MTTKCLQGFVFMSLVFSKICFAITDTSFIEENGQVIIEAEDFASQHLDDTRRWLVFGQNLLNDYGNLADADLPHWQGASNGKYIEILPDTRTNHFETLVKGENFSNEAGKIAILSYPVYFSTPGKYVVWARAFSTGTEDNGIHIGLNGEWPESAQRLQLCEGKHKWTWSSAQRMKDNHCGTSHTISIDVPSSGVHNVMVSMREDGFELDQLLLTQDIKYVPSGPMAASNNLAKPPLQEKSQLFSINEYKRILYALEDFTLDETRAVPYYEHKAESALAIDATKKAYRQSFAAAQYLVSQKDAGLSALTLVTLTEIDGESTYRVSINGKLVGEFTNPETETDYREAYFNMKDIDLKAGDIIEVASNAVTNGKIPENDETAFARGRWRALVIGRK